MQRYIVAPDTELQLPGPPGGESRLPHPPESTAEHEALEALETAPGGRRDVVTRVRPATRALTVTLLAIYGLVGGYFLVASAGEWRGVAAFARASGLACIGADLFAVYGAMRWPSLRAINATDGALRGVIVGIVVLGAAGGLLALLP